MYLFDTFTNFLSGLGVFGRDKSTASQYVTTIWTREQLEAAYRTDWIARKAISIPPFNSTREWRNWQAEGDQIEKLEKTENRLQVQLKLQQGLTKARLYGGATIMIGVEGDMASELDPETIKKDGLKFLHVLAPHQLHVEQLVRDISSPYYGQPEHYILRSDGGMDAKGAMKTLLGEVKIHPSRMVRLIGLDPPDPLLNFGWGDPLMMTIYDAVNASGLVMQSIAALIQEAKFDVIKIPGLTEIFSTTKGTERLVKRFSEANVAKSIINAVVMDAEEEWQRIGVTFTGMPEILQTYLQIAAGAADIPATRFLGMSPAGLNATGESDLQNYYDRIAAEQELRLKPALEKLDKAIMMSALGEHDENIYYEWNPLWQMTEAEKSDISFKKAQATSLDVNSGLVPFEALVKGRCNQLIEDGTYPGLEQAIEDAVANMETMPQDQTGQLPPPGAPPLLPPPRGGGSGGQQPGMEGQVTPKDSMVINGTVYTREQLGAAVGKRRAAKMLFDAAWQEEHHSRGQPKNKGQFGPGGGGTQGPTPEEKSHRALTALSGKKPTDMVKAPSPETFVAARDKSTRPQFLSPHPAEELANHKLFMNKDGTAGVSVDPQGDVQNVFNNGGPRGSGAYAMVTAIENGGRTLDCYDGHLNAFYHQFGFEEDGRMKFNPDFAPKGWDFDKMGTPDIVFMSWRGYLGKDGADAIARANTSDRANWDTVKRSDSYVTDWDAAKETSRANAGSAGADQQKAQRGGSKSGQNAGARKGAQADGSGDQLESGAGADGRRSLDAGIFKEELHPRVESGPTAGQFGSAGGVLRAQKNARAIMALGPRFKKHELGPGYSKSAKLDAQGVIHTDNVYDAVLALHQDRRVELKQPKQVSTLIAALGDVTKHMVEAGEHVPNFDLCKVTVKGTNLFCADTKGIPRVKMPQMDDEQTKKFVKYLKRNGYEVSKDTEKSANLRATQNQLDAAKVNKFYQRIKKDPDRLGDDKRLVVSQDDYVLDGHHHWAAQVAADAQDNRLGNHETRVFRVNIDIITLYQHAMKFTGGKGAKGQGDAAPFREELHPRVKGGSTAGQFGTGTGTSKAEKSKRATAALARAHMAQSVRAAGWQSEVEAQNPGLAPEAEPSKKGTLKTKKNSKKEDFEKAKIRIRSDADIEKWNSKIGIDPDEFKKTFLGGVNATMNIYTDGSKFKVGGDILNADGDHIGEYNREIDPDHKSAYSAYFKLNKSQTHNNIGKKVLGGNIETYEALGIDTVKVTANIDVGGYAWAKYGYVPTPEAWRSLSASLEEKLQRGVGRRQTGQYSTETYAADEWSQLTDDQQAETERQWFRDSREEFIDSEISSWRDSGQPLEDSKVQLAEDFDRDANWANEAMLELRIDRGAKNAPEIPFTNDELLRSMSVDYSSRYQDGNSDPDFSFDDKSLHEAKADPNQPELPGIEERNYAEKLTDEMRTAITDKLTAAFNTKAEQFADDMEAPDYISQQVEEYQQEYWDQKDDAEKLRHARDYGNDQVEIEGEEQVTEEVKLDIPETETDQLLDLVRESDPKNIWKVADSSRGKELLLDSGWSGVLNLKDKESYDRFKKYVSKVKGEQRAAA